MRGLNILNLQTALVLHPADYRLQVTYHHAGIVGALVDGDATITVDGRLAGGHAEPRETFSTGCLRGNPRVTQIDWQDGSPKVVQMVPPVETERDPVPVADQAHSPYQGLAAAVGPSQPGWYDDVFQFLLRALWG